MRKIFFNHRGFTFVESLITLSVVGIFLLLTWGTVQFLLTKSNDQIVRTRGHFFAMEGLEIVKQIRQTAVNQNRETGFSDALGKKEGRYIIEVFEEGFSLKSGEAEAISMTEEPFIDYCRTLEITGDSPQLKKITSIVTWGDPDCEEVKNSIRYSTYLADIKK